VITHPVSGPYISKSTTDRYPESAALAIVEDIFPEYTAAHKIAVKRHGVGIKIL
jgi:hypothetical protein